MESRPLLSIEETEEEYIGCGSVVKNKMKAILNCSIANYLLIMVPIGIIGSLYIRNPTFIFLSNFLAVIPLAAILSFATEELAEHVGQTVGGLLNATFGNAVELIISVTALKKGEIRLVQTSMLGSILSNLLLVLGCCFVAGGYDRIQQRFNQTVAQTMSSLMSLTVSALLIPAAVHATVENSDREVLMLSRGTAIIMLMIYCLYIFFQLKTHAKYFDEFIDQEQQQQDEQDSLIEPATTLNKFESLTVLSIVAVLVSFCTNDLIDSIDPIVEQTGVTKTFLGLIVLPIIGNATEHATAVIVAMKDKMDLAIGVAVGSSMQIGLFLTPFLVILGWIIDQPMSLYFSTFETAILFVSVFITNSLVLDGESNWLEGALLLGVYGVVGISFFYLPDTVLKY